MYQPAKLERSYSGLFSRKDILLTSAISVTYLLLSRILIGFKTEQLVLVLIFNVLYFLSFATRKFITGFSIYIIYWIIFDYMKAFPNFLYNNVQIESLYNAERTLFGVRVDGMLLTPNEFWQRNMHTSLDILSGIFYLCWVPVPLIFSAYLFFSKKREQFLHFTLTFLLVNLIGFVGYYLYPAAPPWYVQLYGFTFDPHTPGNIAGLQRFDDFFHVKVFHTLYSQSSNVFAAMPSLHSAYPVITLYYGLKGRLGWVNILFALIMVGIWFAAVYTVHHYVLDVIAGLACAVAGIIFFERFLVPNKFFKKTIVDKFVND